jgi:DNA (cytosine-5)-methyltransferase 1
VSEGAKCSLIFLQSMRTTALLKNPIQNSVGSVTTKKNEKSTGWKNEHSYQRLSRVHQRPILLRRKRRNTKREAHKLRILNLYAGIGGNRKQWGEEHDVTAVEIEPDIAKAYKKFYPNDKVIVGDAHKYLLEHFQEYDFIWSSPPCPTHSVLGKINMLRGKTKYLYPDMTLYQEIIFLQQFFKGKLVVENTKSYYEPLIKPQISGSHFFWANFHITNKKILERRAVNETTIEGKEKRLGLDLNGFSFKNIQGSHKKDKVLNNCVEPELGLHVFKCAFKEVQQCL